MLLKYCVRFNHTAVVNKFSQSTLGRGPRRGAVAHICRKVPIGYNGAPQIRPQKYPFPWTDPQTPLSASSLDPSDLRRLTASGSDLPLCHNALERPNDRPTHAPTDRQTDRSSTGKFDDYRPTKIEFYKNQNKKSLSGPPFGGLKGNVRTPPIAARKARGPLGVRHNWTFFAILYGWDVMSRNLSKSTFFEGGGSFWTQISDGRGRRPPATVGVRKLEWLPFRVVSKCPL